MRIAKVLFILILFSLHTVEAKSTSLVACVDEHPPYQILGEKPTGLHIDALEKLAKLLEKEMQYVQSHNFARCVALLERGEVDVIAGLNPTLERKQFAFFAPFKEADSLIVISKEDITINNYDDFKNKIIGIARGALYFPRFDQDTELDKIEIQNDTIGLSLLKMRRIDLMMFSPAFLQMYNKEIENAKLKVSPISLKEMRDKETFFGFSKKIGLEHSLLKEKVTLAYKNGFFHRKPKNNNE